MDQPDPSGLPDLVGTYAYAEETVHRGYNTDTEEMDSWSEWECAHLHFSEDGSVRALVSGDAPGPREVEALVRRPPNGSWQRAVLDQRVGYAVTLELPYAVPTFWVSHGGPTQVFLWWEGEELGAQRFWPQGGWGRPVRSLAAVRGAS